MSTKPIPGGISPENPVCLLKVVGCVCFVRAMSLDSDPLAKPVVIDFDHKMCYVNICKRSHKPESSWR